MLLGISERETFKVLKASKVLRDFMVDNSGRVARDFIFYCYLCLRIIYIINHSMGRNKFSQREIEIIGKLLRRKMAGTRFQQKMVRHTLRTTFEFNIADFDIQGKAFGPEALGECVLTPWPYPDSRRCQQRRHQATPCRKAPARRSTASGRGRGQR